jgi:hypothetical protein
VKEKALTLLGVVFILLPIACATALPIPTQETVSPMSLQQSGTTLAALQDGRGLYVAHCASCHNLHLPCEFSKVQWDKIMFKMQAKSKIDDPTKDSILAYLKIMAAPE